MMMSCRDATRLLSERLEHPLGWRRAWAVRMHVLICAACRRYDKQIRWLHVRLRGEARAEPSAALDPAARERIIARLHNAQSEGHTGHTDPA